MCEAVRGSARMARGWNPHLDGWPRELEHQPEVQQRHFRGTEADFQMRRKGALPL